MQFKFKKNFTTSTQVFDAANKDQGFREAWRSVSRDQDATATLLAIRKVVNKRTKTVDQIVTHYVQKQKQPHTF